MLITVGFTHRLFMAAFRGMGCVIDADILVKCSCEMLHAFHKLKPKLLLHLYLHCARQHAGSLHLRIIIYELWIFDALLHFFFEGMSSSNVCFCVLQNHCALEGIPSVSPWVSSHQLWAGGYGPKVHHRSNLQWLHLRLWVWHIHQALSGRYHTDAHCIFLFVL